MSTFNQFNATAQKLSTVSRISRLAAGTVLLAIPMSSTGVLGPLAMLPLLAIYPILTGILGYGLVGMLLVNHRAAKQSALLPSAARTGLLVLGAGLIGSVVAGSAPAWVALLGVFPVLMGALGIGLVSDALVSRRSLDSVGQNTGVRAEAYAMSKRVQAAITSNFTEQKAA
jgi:hypothetical protein